MQADIGVKVITEYAIGQSNGMLAIHLSRQISVVTQIQSLKTKLELQT
jgi:hypothetical protein